MGGVLDEAFLSRSKVKVVAGVESENLSTDQVAKRMARERLVGPELTATA